MSNTLLAFGLLICLPYFLIEVHRVFVACYVYWKDGKWVVNEWNYGKPPRLVTLIFRRLK